MTQCEIRPVHGRSSGTLPAKCAGVEIRRVDFTPRLDGIPTPLGRGNESQHKLDDANGLLAQWPLFLDNFFVPRGYAVALVDMTGTNHSTGCPTVQGPTDNNAGPEVIDWLKGRRTAHDKDGNL